MISLTDHISLKLLTTNDQKEVYELMSRIYPPVYQHLWSDHGRWYIDHLYTSDNFYKEVTDTKSEYYFILHRNIKIGILRVLYDIDFTDPSCKKTVKLHRIYIDPNMQGHGIGHTLLAWIEDRSRLKGYSMIWLEVMDSQAAALSFYKREGYKISSSFRLNFQLMYSKFRGMYRMRKLISLQEDLTQK